MCHVLSTTYMNFLYISIFLLACAELEGAELLWADEAHCPVACTECPRPSGGVVASDVCVLIPVLMQFQCLCMVHHALCNGFAQNVLFHLGKCKNLPYYYLGETRLGLYTFRGLEPVIVRWPSIPASDMNVPDQIAQKLVRIQKTPFDSDELRPRPKIMDLRNDSRRTITSLNQTYHSHHKPALIFNQTELCGLFFKDDKKFQRFYRNKHFQCPNANSRYLQKVSLEELEKEGEAL